MKLLRSISVVVLATLAFSSIAVAEKEFATSDSPVAKTTLSAQFKGKLSPRVLEQVAASISRMEVIVLLNEPDVVAALSSDFHKTDVLQAYMEMADRDIEAVVSSVSSSDLREMHRYRTINAFAAEVSIDALQQLANNPAVRAVNPNLMKQRYRVEGNALMKVNAAHARGARGAGVTVAVIDDGIDYSHPELGGTAIGTFPNSVVIGGYDFVVGNGTQPTEPSPYPRDSDNSHGTSVAGIIAGRGGSGGIGVAPEAKLVGLRIGGSQNGMSTAREIAALDWIVQKRNTFNPAIKIVNMSLGGEPYVLNGCDSHPDVQAEKAAIDRVAQAGVVIVASSGNEAKIGMGVPACLANVVSVGAVYDANIGPTGFSNCTDNSTGADVVTCYSNIDQRTTLYGPSHNAFTPAAGSGGQYDQEFGGTSAASPYVAGAFAVVMGKFPSQTAVQYREIMRATGKPITYSQPGFSVTTPRVDLDAALRSQENTGGSPTGPCQSSASKLCLMANRFEISITATDQNGKTGPGQAVSIVGNDKFGFFSLPALTTDASNPEMLVKMLDARVFGAGFWVFYGPMTTFSVNLTVRDTQTGKTMTYVKPAGVLLGDAKTSDFPGN